MLGKRHQGLAAGFAWLRGLGLGLRLESKILRHNTYLNPLGIGSLGFGTWAPGVIVFVIVLSLPTSL